MKDDVTEAQCDGCGVEGHTTPGGTEIHEYTKQGGNERLCLCEECEEDIYRSIGFAFDSDEIQPDAFPALLADVNALREVAEDHLPPITGFSAIGLPVVAVPVESLPDASTLLHDIIALAAYSEQLHRSANDAPNSPELRRALAIVRNAMIPLAGNPPDYETTPV